MSEGKAKFAMIGLGVMGENLALNVERNGFPIAVWNRRAEAVDAFVNGRGAGKNVVGAHSPAELAAAMERPRRIMMLVKAGEAVDWTIDQMKPHLDKGDVLIDGGNSWYEDTKRRDAALTEEGLHFVGSGVSGGEEGALWGPSLMPGGKKEAYEIVREIFEAVAAKTEDGACVTHCGPDGAGHFVKMIHNGIEYGDMQLIAEAYDIMRNGLGLGAQEMADIFNEWNEGELNSFLIEVTAKVLSVKDDETGNPLVDMILDTAGQKGTGRWTSQVGLDLGVPIPTMNSAIEARFISRDKAERVAASKEIEGPTAKYTGDKKELIDAIRAALYASKITSYAQGMNLIREGSNVNKWGIDLGELSRIWKGGCIIRAQFLDKIKQAYLARPDLPNLLVDPYFKSWVSASQAKWRTAVTTAQTLGVPTLAMSASLAYFDSYRAANLPANLTQAQRDYFGAHTYERVDKPGAPAVHTNWQAKAGH
ncbi:MAG: NADP-dependent phosphogluconate dehydrogenase [Blastocatellia bacterium]|jgi:6-phosphogluconate dehydrogenase|nr:NADP-dependent phosphogluconate dehydrogenase [Blastocatellia bacterium]